MEFLEIIRCPVFCAITVFHVFRFIDSFWHKDNEFQIQQEFCSDGSLRDLLNTRRDKEKADHFEDVRILDWSFQFGLALNYMHDRNILHRDIKVSFS